MIVLFWSNFGFWILAEVKKPKGPPARSEAPEGPKTSCMLIIVLESDDSWSGLLSMNFAPKVQPAAGPLTPRRNIMTTK